MKHKFIGTRSQRKALQLAEAAGIYKPIAVKVNGGFVCYSAYARVQA